MKRWAAITALAVMAVPIAFVLGAFLDIAVMTWRIHCVAGRICIRPIVHDVALNVAVFAIAIAGSAFWWVGWYRLTRASLIRQGGGRPLALFGASQILATEFVFFFALPLFLSASGLSLF